MRTATSTQRSNSSYSSSATLHHSSSCSSASIGTSVCDTLTVIPVQGTLILRSDNASNFKSAEAFDDIQRICNETNINIMRVYGSPGHGKCEVDSAGGHLKNPIRKHITKGNIIHSAGGVAAYLTAKYIEKQQPQYHIKELLSGEMDPEREKRLYIHYDTVNGSDSFRMMLFRPNKEFFYASLILCVCDDCLNYECEKCPNLKQYYPSVTQLSKKHLRSAPPTIEIVDESVQIIPNTVFAICADSEISNYFLVMCDEAEKVHGDPTSPLVDSMGHKIYDGMKYITGRYLELKSFNNRCHIFTVSKKTVLVIAESVLLPYIPILETTKENIKVLNEIVIELQVRSSL